MKKAVVILFLFFISLNSFSQKINGQWRGYFDSRGDIVLSGNRNTEFVLELDITGSEVSGYSYSYFQGRRYYVICAIKGRYDKQTKSIKVTETERVKGNTPPDFTDCLQIHYLTYEKNGREELLTGRWEEVPGQPGGGCGVGKTTLTRRTLSKDLSSFNKAVKPKADTVKKAIAKVPSVSKSNSKPVASAKAKAPVKQHKTDADNKPVLKQLPKADVEAAEVEVKKAKEKAPLPSFSFEKRKNDVLKTIQIQNETFKVDLYDNGDIDGDTVSLFYNGKLLLAHKRLSDKPLSLTLDVKPGNTVNELTMYAENLGEIPPNTALMVVRDGDDRYEVRISSDFKNSGTIHFVHKPKTQ